MTGDQYFQSLIINSLREVLKSLQTLLVKFQENKAQKENFRIGKIRGPAWFRPLGVLIDTAKFALFGGSFGGRIRVRRILGACILYFSSTICVSSSVSKSQSSSRARTMHVF